MDLQMYGVLKDLIDDVDREGELTVARYQIAKAAVLRFEQELDEMAAHFGNC